MATPYPVSIFLDLLGLPQAEMPQLLEWETQLLHSPDNAVRIGAVRAIKSYLQAAIDARRKNPREDLISQALTLEVYGRKWTADEVFGHCFNLYVGGLDTVSSNMGLHFHHLATHPEDQAWIRANPSKLGAALEELLRAYAAVTTWRICAKEFSIGGITMKPGDYVAMPTPLAARDPDEYDRPEQVLFDRQPTHLTFAFGPHRCLGVHLARRELQIGMQEVLEALPSFRLQEGAKVGFYVGNVIHVDSLPLAWDA
jgi:cytochrome P450